MKIFKYLIRELKNLFEFYLIPWLVVMLPHRVYYPIFKFICRYTFFYSVYSKGSYQYAIKYIPNCHTPKIWERNVRLLYLIDISDSWLAWLRPQKARNIQTKVGEWKSETGFLALSVHWGAGFLSLPDIQRSGFNPFFVFSGEPIKFEYQGIMEKYYRKIRRYYVNKISGSVAIPTGGGYQIIKDQVSQKGVPVILFDAPKDEENAKNFLMVFNYKYNIASGFINLICKENIPYQLFSVLLDFKSGKRKLRINNLKNVDSEQELIQELSIFFEILLTESPEHWFFWRQSSALFIEKNQEPKG